LVYVAVLKIAPKYNGHPYKPVYGEPVSAMGFLDTELRCGELCSLTLEDVHLDSKHCCVKVFGKGLKKLTNCCVHQAPDQLAAFQKRLSTGSD